MVSGLRLMSIRSVRYVLNDTIQQCYQHPTTLRATQKSSLKVHESMCNSSDSRLARRMLTVRGPLTVADMCV